MLSLTARLATGVALALALAGCKGGMLGGESSSDKDVTKPAAKPAGGAVENQYGTPVKDRVATLGIINKRNNLVQDIVLKSGEQRTVGNVVVKMATCEKTAPWERPQEVGAFVQVFVQEHARVADPVAWHKVFSGWLFKNSPSLNVVEHPVYDVWVKDCAMKFPGEEESPDDFKAAAKAPKAAGSGTPANGPADAAPPPPALPAGDEDNGGEAPAPN